MAKKLPKTIFVKWEQPRNDEPFMVASVEMDAIVDLGGKTQIGKYQLVELTTAEMVVKNSPPKRVR